MPETPQPAGGQTVEYALNRKYSPAVRRAAWEDWKAFCSVGNLHPDSEPMRERILAGEITRDDAQTEFDFVKAKINSFWGNSLKMKTCGLDEEILKQIQAMLNPPPSLNPQKSSQNRNPEEEETDDASAAKGGPYLYFDADLHEMSSPEAPDGVWKKVKKDHIWALAAEAPDPLECIEGNVFFLVLSVIGHALVHKFASVSGLPADKWIVEAKSWEELLEKTLPDDRDDEEPNADIPADASPEDDEDTDDEGEPDLRSIPDASSCESEPPPELIAKLVSRLSFREKIMFVARCAGCNITDPAVLTAMGGYSSPDTGSKVCKELRMELSHMLHGEVDDFRMTDWPAPEVMKLIKKRIFAEMRSEKAATPFFDRMEQAKKGDQK